MTKIMINTVDRIKIRKEVQIWYNEIVKQNKINDFNQWIAECYPDGITEKTINDILQYDTENIFDSIGVKYDFYPWLNK